MPSLELINISKSYPQKKGLLKVLEDFNLKVSDKEIVSLFGPNGCGKTVLLKIISGIEKQDNGTILFDEAETRSYDTGFVFQDYRSALFPWRTVEENLHLGLEFRNVSKQERKQIVKRLLNKTGLFEYKDKYPYQLSGGMAQLVATCRVVAYNPSLLLFDEPSSSLDYKSMREIEKIILNLWEENKATTVFVSHNIDEAVFMADRVAVLSPRPAHIRGIITTNLPRPRTFDIVQSKEFFYKRNEVLELFNY